MFYAICISLLVGLVGGIWIYRRFTGAGISGLTGSKSVVETHQILMLEKVERVLKLVTTEGYYAEIMDYKHENKQLWGLLSSTKKSLVVCNAKVLIGFDLKKIQMHIDQNNRRLEFVSAPEPEILAIEPDIKFYDIEDGWFNKFEAEDYNLLLKDAKQQVANKVYDSELLLIAKKQLRVMLEQLTESTGYRLELNNRKILPESDKDVMH